MDGVLVDYDGIHKGKENFFSNMKPVPNAIESVKKLNQLFDCYVLTTAPWSNPFALQEKKEWIELYFGDIFFKKIIFTHNKNLLIGDFLIDDRLVNGAAEFTGNHIHFATEKFPDWNSVLDYLIK